jgi:hypothetical protein
MTFKEFMCDAYKDYSMTRIVKKCTRHDPALAMME